MKGILLLIAALLGGGLAGCAGFGLSAEQIKELSQSQSSVCVHAPAWNGSAADLHYTFFGGKSTGTAGGGGKSTCGNSIAEFTNEGKAQAAMVSAGAFMAPEAPVQLSPSEAAAARLEQDRARQVVKRAPPRSREDE